MNVLIVEDDCLIAELLESIILELFLNASVSRVSSVQDAVSVWIGTVFNVLLTDYDLPDGNGVQIAKCFSARYPAAVVVMISSRVDGQSIVSAGEVGISHYFAKPFEALTLARQLQRVLKKADNSGNTGQPCCPVASK